MKIINIADHQGRKLDATPSSSPGKRRRLVPEFGSASALMNPEDRAKFDATRRRYAVELQPAGIVEEEIVHMIADSDFRSWRTHKMLAILRERQTHGVESSLKTMDCLARHLVHLEKSKSRARLHLARMQKWRKQQNAHLVAPVSAPPAPA